MNQEEYTITITQVFRLRSDQASNLTYRDLLFHTPHSVRVTVESDNPEVAPQVLDYQVTVDHPIVREVRPGEEGNPIILD